jgi:hypothetical protein
MKNQENTIYFAYIVSNGISNTISASNKKRERE